MTRFLNSIAQYPIILIFLCTFLYTLYAANTKLATESYGAGIDGLMLAPWVTLVAVAVNVVFYAVTGLFNWQRIRKEWIRFLVSGTAVGSLIISGVLLLALKIVKLTEGATLQKALGVPMSIIAILIFLKQERSRLRHDYYQLSGGALALVAIYLNMKGISGGRIMALPFFVIILLIMYALGCLVRTPIMRTDKGKNKLEFGAGEQPFSTLLVVIFCALVAFGDLTILPDKLQEPLLKMQTGLLHPTWNIIKWACIIGVPFGLYAPTSVLLLMYTKGGSTAMLGYIMQKLAGVSGAVLGLPILHLFVGLFFPYQENLKVPWYESREIQALLLFSLATFVSLIPQLRVYLRKREEENEAKKQNSLLKNLPAGASPA